MFRRDLLAGVALAGMASALPKNGHAQAGRPAPAAPAAPAAKPDSAAKKP